MREIIILGSTGSIGAQAVDIARRLPGRIRVTALSAFSSGEMLLKQAVELGVKKACLADERSAREYKLDFSSQGIDLYGGEQGLIDMIDETPAEIAMNSLVGISGLKPTLRLIETGKNVALANKESLVTAGNIVMRLAKMKEKFIIPVDSEHSGLFQCIRGEDREQIRRLILTASGGAFRDLSPEELERVTVSQALSHPTWAMGKKVTIDSATLMNKGLEVIEAHHFFGIAYEAIDVILHRESVVHAMVEMKDGSVLAQMSVPDMRIPIQFALLYPERDSCPASYLSLEDYGSLSFELVDTGRYPCLELARRAGVSGMTYPTALNAADEVAVEAFLSGRIKFTDIPHIVENVLEKHKPLSGMSVDEIMEADALARSFAGAIVKGIEEKRMSS